MMCRAALCSVPSPQCKLAAQPMQVSDHWVHIDCATFLLLTHRNNNRVTSSRACFPGFSGIRNYSQRYQHNHNLILEHGSSGLYMCARRTNNPATYAIKLRFRPYAVQPVEYHQTCSVFVARSCVCGRGGAHSTRVPCTHRSARGGGAFFSFSSEYCLLSTRGAPPSVALI
eukprot:SAG11_NODE_1490_length_4810_cov_4.090851_3_plen_171_part_00